MRYILVPSTQHIAMSGDGQLVRDTSKTIQLWSPFLSVTSRTRIDIASYLVAFLTTTFELTQFLNNCFADWIDANSFQKFQFPLHLNGRSSSKKESMYFLLSSLHQHYHCIFITTFITTAIRSLYECLTKHYVTSDTSWVLIFAAIFGFSINCNVIGKAVTDPYTITPVPYRHKFMYSNLFRRNYT